MRILVLSALVVAPALAAAQTVGLAVGYLEVMPTVDYNPNVPETHTGYATQPAIGSRTATFAISYRQQLNPSVMLQPEVHYTRFLKQELRSADVTIPILLRYGGVRRDGSRFAGVLSAGVAPSFQVACNVRRTFHFATGNETVRQGCNATEVNSGYHTHRMDITIVGGFGIEGRLAGEWISGAELRITRGLSAVSVTYPRHRTQTLQLLIQIVPPVRGSARAPRAPSYEPAPEVN